MKAPVGVTDFGTMGSSLAIRQSHFLLTIDLRPAPHGRVFLAYVVNNLRQSVLSEHALGAGCGDRKKDL